MKITITPTKSKAPKTPKYPNIASFIEDALPLTRRLVVLFTGPGHGIVVQKSDNDSYKVGSNYDMWGNEDCPEEWETVPAGYKVTFTQS